jgi:nucleotidyltransferase/DNA polymerase involved in DNA repair
LLIDLINGPLELLKKQVLLSILGYYWYLHLRGYEIDVIDFKRKSFGNTYALGKQTNAHRELVKLLMKLCEKTGRRLRRAKYSAQGVEVALTLQPSSRWWRTSSAVVSGRFVLNQGTGQNDVKMHAKVEASNFQ